MRYNADTAWRSGTHDSEHMGLQASGDSSPQVIGCLWLSEPPSHWLPVSAGRTVFTGAAGTRGVCSWSIGNQWEHDPCGHTDPDRASNGRVGADREQQSSYVSFCSQRPEIGLHGSLRSDSLSLSPPELRHQPPIGSSADRPGESCAVWSDTAPS